MCFVFFFFFQAEDGIRDYKVTGVQTCALPLALWWAGCFPEWVERGSSGNGMVRAYVTFAGRMLALAADLLESSAPEEAALCARAAEARTELHAALAEARVDYIGEDPHSSESRLNRFLRRLAQDN